VSEIVLQIHDHSPDAKTSLIISCTQPEGSCCAEGRPIECKDHMEIDESDTHSDPESKPIDHHDLPHSIMPRLN
jgi:hypothetical protein